MTEDENRAATLHNGAVSTDFPTLQDAVMAWHRLRPEQAQKASIRIIGGKLYAAAEIVSMASTVPHKTSLPAARMYMSAAPTELVWPA